VIERLQQELARVAAPYVQDLALRIVAAERGEVTLALPVTPHLVHGGGVLCGQAIMAAMDTAMVLALCAQLGEFRPMTTVQLQTTFLRPVPAGAGEVQLLARVLRAGKTLVYGDISLTGADGKLAAHATTTYALL
jgi:uncharacterized protein (TIGR00369 family)